MRTFVKAVSLFVLFLVTVGVPVVWATWVGDGSSICAATNNQLSPQITSDGAGGAIVTWYDYRSGSSYDVYAQRIDASGAVQWTADGVAICTYTGDQILPTTISDGAGGAIIAWEDKRGNGDIYVQRVNASGVVQWTANGVAICTYTGAQQSPMITSDGAGGAIITWLDLRSGSSVDLYAQRVNASGVVQWTADGVAISTATQNQQSHAITSDGAGGAIITWMDYRSGSNWDIYAQRVNASGTVQWTADGVAISTATQSQQTPAITSDGASGAIITWMDYRSGLGYTDIYAQRVNASGGVQWVANGVAICTSDYWQQNPQLVSDGAGGAIITWFDSRSHSGNDIYAQRVNASGAVQWTANGVDVCAAAGDKEYPMITSDGAGGAIITWQDLRGGLGYTDIYAQRVNASGAVKWTAGAVAICTATGHQQSHAITSDAAGGAIIAWQDYRSGSYSDVYAQFVSDRGRTGDLAPRIYSVRDVPGDQGGLVYLSWYASKLDVVKSAVLSHYTLWRAISSSKAAMLVEGGAEIVTSLSDVGGVHSISSIRVEQTTSGPLFWQYMGTQAPYYLSGYSLPMATLFDSTSVCTERHYFQVIAHSTDPTVFWVSDADSGYSVDNLSPDPPQGVAGNYTYPPAELVITWETNTEADLSHYAVYKGDSEGFVPSESNRIGTPEDTSFTDTSFDPTHSYYKISAWDIHENESGYSLLRPQDITGADGVPAVPAITALEQNVPNPFNPVTVIRFAIASPGWVELRVYDVAGRPVRTLAEGVRAVQRYEVTWDGRDDGGVSVASGVYVCELRAPGCVESKKMVLLK